MLVISLDLGKYHSMACLLDSQTREPQFAKVTGNREAQFGFNTQNLILGQSGIRTRLVREFGSPGLNLSTNPLNV